MAAKRQRRESPRPRALTEPSGRKLPPTRAATLQRSEVTRPFQTWTYEVNARCLELLGHRAGSASPRMELTAELSELGVLLDPVVRTRLAARPYLLVNMRFQDESWWQAARRAPKARASPHQHLFPRGDCCIKPPGRAHPAREWAAFKPRARQCALWHQCSGGAGDRSPDAR